MWSILAVFIAGTHHLNFDTGSADIWVPASDCHRCGGQRHYESSLSGSLRTETTEKRQVRYGDGSVVSVMYHWP
ncbi:hypothetical protein FB192DRAFT_1132990 [Mucor lusitanicus]|uniref:Peptidase A1 domain-containing protein n=1 Tax=Mucor circinelloides f. lusitanicus TaxID=29924 RepID=A0A8H4BBV6_MUCCL|nr:hypothetical protein FB192DRAFT_1132990 [Mucor lusitanicus]